MLSLQMCLDFVQQGFRLSEQITKMCIQNHAQTLNHMLQVDQCMVCNFLTCIHLPGAHDPDVVQMYLI